MKLALALFSVACLFACLLSLIVAARILSARVAWVAVGLLAAAFFLDPIFGRIL